MSPSDRPASDNGAQSQPVLRSGRLLAIGDIHGCVKPLRALLDAISLQADDTLVILGDFINRGIATKEVIDCINPSRPAM